MDIPLGLLLIVVGAVLAFAVQDEPSGLDLDALGWVLIIVGIGLIAWTLAWWGWQRRTRVVEMEHEIAPPVTERIVEHQVPVPPARRFTERLMPSYRRRRLASRGEEAPTERIVERGVPPSAGQVVEREVTAPRTERIVERDVYDDRNPPR